MSAYVWLVLVAKMNFMWKRRRWSQRYIGFVIADVDMVLLYFYQYHHIITILSFGS